MEAIIMVKIGMFKLHATSNSNDYHSCRSIDNLAVIKVLCGSYENIAIVARMLCSNIHEHPWCSNHISIAIYIYAAAAPSIRIHAAAHSVQ